MSSRPASCRRRAAPSCSSPTISARQSTCWTARWARGKERWSGEDRRGDEGMTRFLMGVAGIALIVGLAVLLSSNRRAIRLRVVAAAFALQAGIAVLVLYTSWGRAG